MFQQVGWAGGIWVGGMPKNMALEGGPEEKILGVKGGGGGQPRNSFKFWSDGICDNWLITDVQEVPIFPGKYAPGPSTLSCTKKQLYATKMLK